MKNTDRYAAIKLHKEFQQATEDLKLSATVNKIGLFDLLVTLGYLKSEKQPMSEYAINENNELFEKVCACLRAGKTQENNLVFEI